MYSTSSSICSRWLLELNSSASSVTWANSAPKGFESLVTWRLVAFEGCTDETAGAVGAAEAVVGAGARGKAGARGCFARRPEIDELCTEECIEECAEEGAEEFVDTDGEREEKAWRLLDTADNSESLEMRVMDRDLATASTEFFLV